MWPSEVLVRRRGTDQGLLITAPPNSDSKVNRNATGAAARSACDIAAEERQLGRPSAGAIDKRVQPSNRSTMRRNGAQWRRSGRVQIVRGPGRFVFCYQAKLGGEKRPSANDDAKHPSDRPSERTPWFIRAARAATLEQHESLAGGPPRCATVLQLPEAMGGHRKNSHQSWVRRLRGGGKSRVRCALPQRSRQSTLRI